MDVGADLLSSGKYSDLTIKCGDRSFKVHKAVVCPKSPVIAAECDQDVKEKTSGVIDHTVYDADTVFRMLQFLYTKTYSVTEPGSNEDNRPPPGTSAATPSGDNQNAPSQENPDQAIAEHAMTAAEFIAELVAHAHVYGIADYYAINDLQSMAELRFREVTGKEWPAAAADDFTDVVEEVCKVTNTSETTGLRTALRILVVDHADILSNNDRFIAKLGSGGTPETQAFAAEVFRHAGSRLRIFWERNAKLNKELEYSRRMHDNLMKCLHRVPKACKNSGCDERFSGLTYEQFGATWMIRCTRCRCRVVLPPGM